MTASTLTTALERADQQFALWEDAVRGAFVPVSLARRADGPFHGAISGGSAGPLGLFQIDADEQHVTRTPALVARCPSALAYVNLPTRAGGVIRQDGRETIVAAGSFAIIDGSRPFELDFASPFHQLAVALPLDILALSVTSLDAVTAVAVDATSGIGAIVAATVTTAVDQLEDLDAGAGERLAWWIAGMVGLALREPGPIVPITHRAALRAAAQDAIENCLGDPEFGVGSLAAQLHVSIRVLQRIFAEQGTTFGRYLLMRRLARCHADLIDPAFGSTSVSALAERRGLTDPAYFARAFRSRYGYSATELRRAAVLQAAQLR